MNEPCSGCREYVDRVVDRLTGLFSEQLRERFSGSDRHHEQRLGYETEILNQRLNDMDKALALQRDLDQQKLVLQSREYERRLLDLNNSHEKAVFERGRVVPREVYELFVKEYDTFKLDTYTRLTAISTRSAVWTTVLGIAFVIINLLVAWKRQ